MLRQDSSVSCSEDIEDVKNCDSNKILKYFNKLKNTKVFNELDPLIENNGTNIVNSLTKNENDNLNIIKNGKYMGNMIISSIDSMEDINNNIGINIKSLEFPEMSETYSSCSSSEFTFNSGNNESQKSDKISTFDNSDIKRNIKSINNENKDNLVINDIENKKSSNDIGKTGSDNTLKNNIYKDISENLKIISENLKNAKENSKDNELIKKNNEGESNDKKDIKEKKLISQINKAIKKEENNIKEKSSDIKDNNKSNETKKNIKTQNIDHIKNQKLIEKINNELAKEEKKEQMKNSCNKPNNLNIINNVNQPNPSTTNFENEEKALTKTKKRNSLKSIKNDKKFNNIVSKKIKKAEINNQENDDKNITKEEKINLGKFINFKA